MKTDLDLDKVYLFIFCHRMHGSIVYAMVLCVYILYTVYTTYP